MITRTIVLMSVLSGLSLLVLLFTTTPATAGPLGILAFFVFMYISALGALTFLFYGTSRAVTRLFPARKRKASFAGASIRKSYYYASVAASIPVMLVAIQSVGELGVYQILLVAFFVLIAMIYVRNRLS